MAPHSSTLAWKIPWMEESGGLQSMGSLRVRQDTETSLSLIGEGNGNPLQCSCLENPRDWGASWAAVFGVAQSWTQLKRLSSRQCRQKIPRECHHPLKKELLAWSGSYITVDCRETQPREAVDRQRQKRKLLLLLLLSHISHVRLCATP